MTNPVSSILQEGRDRRLRHRPHTTMSFEVGDIIHREGDPADALYIVSRGVLLLSRLTSDGEEKPISILSAGDMFGDDNLIEGIYLTTATCLTDVTLRAVGYDRLQPDDMPFLLWNSVERHRKLLEHTSRISTSSVRVRVCDVLTRLLTTELAEPHESGAFVVRLSQQQISDLAHARRESTAKVLAELRAEELITTGYNVVAVLDPMKLVEIAEGFGD